MGLPGTSVLYRAVSRGELQQIRESGFRRFPLLPPGQPMFKPALTREHAAEAAAEWSAKEKTRSFSGFVTRFHVDSQFLSRYSPHRVGSPVDQEYWIPAEDLDAFNDHISGIIEIIAEYHGVPDDAA